MTMKMVKEYGVEERTSLIYVLWSWIFGRFLAIYK
jgi:hypothetical protein